MTILEYSNDPQNVQEIASRQKAILYCILINIVLYVVLLSTQQSLPLAAMLLLWLAMLAVEVTAAVFVFLLTTKLYGTGVGIALGILVLIPCIGLITLLVVNGKATAVLRQHGVKVGLMGAKL